MKKLLLATAVLVGVFATTSCQKEELQNGSEESVLQFSASIEPGASTKTTVEKVTSPSVAYKTKWENTDCIKIEGATYQATPNSTDATKAAFTKTSGEDPTVTPYKAYYPASMFDGTTATLPASYTYAEYAEGKFNMPMYAESTNKILLFKNLCGVLAITVPSDEISTVSSITVVSDKQMNGAFTADENGVLTFTTGELTDANKQVTMTFSTAKTIDDSTTFYIPVPADTHNPLTITVSDGTNSKIMVTKKSDGVVVEKNTVYPIKFADNQPISFSVSATKKVIFSPGNLQATINASGEPTAWKFAANQYTYLGTGGANQTIGTTAGDIDLFGWSTNGGSTPLPANYKKWGINTSKNINDYAGSFVDWGTNPALISALGSGWSTLSIDEWKNLFGLYGAPSPRANASSLCKYNVKVCGVSSCWILAPDGYNYTNYPLQKEYNTESSEQYPLTWAQAEAKGLVCLPLAGYRTGNQAKDSGSTGYYWSSTPRDESYTFYFRLYMTDADVDYDRSIGCSVRLVQTIPQPE